ncbi:MAG: Mur ligase family protein, partial [Bacteroidota bacterium]|nr:Mur ligase family protein [Bacteroidota bacterium]
MTVEQLYQLYKGHPEVCTDTREILPGCIFFALSGAHFDGNKFAMEALKKGAAYAVVSDPGLQQSQFIYTEDTLLILQQLALFHRESLQIPFLAITGSNGKTTTKELVSTVLSKQYKIHATVGNFNNHIGVPLTLLQIKEDTEIAVIEMGANHIGEISALCQIAKPTHGLITNIGRAHLEGFGSLEGVKQGKGELFDFLHSHNGITFVNADDSRVRE